MTEESAEKNEITDIPTYSSILPKLLLDEIVDENNAKAKIRTLEALLPVQFSPYSPSGRLSLVRLPLLVGGVILISALMTLIADYYVAFIHIYVAETFPDLTGAAYGMRVGQTFYVIGAVLAANIAMSAYGAYLLVRLGRCRNNWVYAAAAITPTSVVILYLIFVVSPVANGEGPQTFIMMVSVLFGISGLVAALATWRTSPIFDEDTGVYLRKWKSKPYSVESAESLMSALSGNDSDEIPRVLHELRQANSDTYLQLIVWKPPSESDYRFGYVAVDIRFSIKTGQSNQTFAKDWKCLFVRLDKARTESLYSVLSKGAAA